MKWTVLGSGRSALDWQGTSGPVVAINRSIMHPGVLDAGLVWWVALDRPQLFTEDEDLVTRLAYLRPTLVTRAMRWRAWREALLPHGIKLGMKSGHYMSIDRRQGTRTIWMALSEVMNQGPAEIHLWGVDNEGAGSYHPETGEKFPSRRKPAWWEKRWALEREVLAKFFNHATNQGIRVCTNGSIWETGAKSIAEQRRQKERGVTTRTATSCVEIAGP